MIVTAHYCTLLQVLCAQTMVKYHQLAAWLLGEDDLLLLRSLPWYCHTNPDKQSTKRDQQSLEFRTPCHQPISPRSATPTMSSVPPRGVQCGAHLVPVLFGHDRCCEESQSQAAGASHAKHCETGIAIMTPLQWVDFYNTCILKSFETFVFLLLCWKD